MQRNLWPGTVIDSPRVGRGERVASEKKKRRAGRKGREKREQQQQQRQRALLGRTPTGLFQYYARWQVSLCPEWHVISVTSSRFDQVIEFSFSTWPRKIGCRDTPTNPRPGRRGRFSTPWNTCRRGSLILLSPNERALFDFFIPPPGCFLSSISFQEIADRRQTSWANGWNFTSAFVENRESLPSWDIINRVKSV